MTDIYPIHLKISTLCAMSRPCHHYCKIKYSDGSIKCVDYSAVDIREQFYDSLNESLKKHFDKSNDYLYRGGVKPVKKETIKRHKVKVTGWSDPDDLYRKYCKVKVSNSIISIQTNDSPIEIYNKYNNHDDPLFKFNTFIIKGNLPKDYDDFEKLEPIIIKVEVGQLISNNLYMIIIGFDTNVSVITYLTLSEINKKYGKYIKQSKLIKYKYKIIRYLC